jgi:hypothetical protein
MMDDENKGIYVVLGILLVLVLVFVYVIFFLDIGSDVIEDIESDSIVFCKSINDDEVLYNFVFERVESNVPGNVLLELSDFRFHKFGTDLVNESRVLWEVVCESDLLICNACHLRVSKDCACNSLVARHHFNTTELKTFGGI